MTTTSDPLLFSGTLGAHAIARAQKVIAELGSRQMEALRLYEPMPPQLAFHSSNAPERLLRGSNRGGKTLGGAMEVAWAVTGTHPHLKYAPKMRVYIVGEDERQIGEVLWPKLRDPHESIRIIRDEETGDWRTFRPWVEADVLRKGDSTYGPPILPDRFVVKNGITWYKKKAGIPRIVRLTNGSRIYFMTAAGKPPQGSRIHLAWFDEEIPNREWYREISMRLIDLSGRFYWTATPRAGTQELWDLHVRAEDNEDKPDPLVTEHFLLLDNNKFLTERDKQIAKSKVTDPNEYRVRILGEYAVSGFHIFPEFNMDTHGVQPFEIPRDWTRYMIVDPGYARCAILFAAVPPSADAGDFKSPVPLGDHVYLYDEIYEENCTAARFGELVANKVQDYVFWEFVIDSHGSRMTTISGNPGANEQYSAELKRRKVASVRSGSGFIPSADERVVDGILSMHEWLHVRPETGSPKLRVFRGRLPNFEHEVGRYRKKRNPDGTYNETPMGGRKFHLTDCWRYLCQRKPKWHRAPTIASRPTGALKAFKEWRKSMRRRQGGADYINLGPGSGSHQGVIS